MSEQTILIKHNVEMGHRLSLQPGSKCYQLHGHSWWVEVEITGEVTESGMILDFALVKRIVRTYLDNHFDHHMCLNENDPLVKELPLEVQHNWGIVQIPMDPTVENMARHWGYWIEESFGNNYQYYVKVWEASTNAATWRSDAKTE